MDTNILNILTIIGSILIILIIYFGIMIQKEGIKNKKFVLCILTSLFLIIILLYINYQCLKML